MKNILKIAVAALTLSTAAAEARTSAALSCSGEMGVDYALLGLNDSEDAIVFAPITPDATEDVRIYYWAVKDCKPAGAGVMGCGIGTGQELRITPANISFTVGGKTVRCRE